MNNVCTALWADHLHDKTAGLLPWRCNKGVRRGTREGAGAQAKRIARRVP